MIDLSQVIGVYVLCNTGAVLVHRIDDEKHRVLASVNGEHTEWCEMTERTRSDSFTDEDADTEPGFLFGSLFVPFADVMRF